MTRRFGFRSRSSEPCDGWFLIPGFRFSVSGFQFLVSSLQSLVPSPPSLTSVLSIPTIGPCASLIPAQA